MKQNVFWVLYFFFICFSLNSTAQIEKKSLEEFCSGKITKYSTFGSGKSLGLRLHIKYPSSWNSQEGEHPHIVRKFTQPDQYTIGMLVVYKLDKSISQTESEDIFTPEGLKLLVPDNGKTIKAETNLKIEGLRAASLDISYSSQRLDRVFDTYNRVYVFFYRNYMVELQFMVSGTKEESNKHIYDRFTTLQPLFTMMFNSIVIDNRWE